MPDASSVAGAAKSLEDGGFEVRRDGDDAVARDPWGIQLRLTPSASAPR